MIDDLIWLDSNSDTVHSLSKNYTVGEWHKEQIFGTSRLYHPSEHISPSLWLILWEKLICSEYYSCQGVCHWEFKILRRWDFLVIFCSINFFFCYFCIQLFCQPNSTNIFSSYQYNDCTITMIVQLNHSLFSKVVVAVAVEETEAPFHCNMSQLFYSLLIFSVNSFVTLILLLCQFFC